MPDVAYLPRSSPRAGLSLVEIARHDVAHSDHFPLLEPGGALYRALFDLLPVGVILLDEAGEVTAANRAAHEVVDASDCMRLEESEFAFDDPRHMLRFHAILADDRIGARNSITIERKRRAPIHIEIRSVACGGRREGTILFLADLDCSAAVDERLLREIYQLTPAEARVASEIVKGRSPHEAAEVLGVEVSTARSHLKHIFEKTETKRQSQLVQKIYAAAAFLPRP